MSTQKVEQLVFDDLEPIQIPVRLAGADYVLKECDENASIAFRNFTSRTIQYGESGNVTRIEGAGEGNAKLLSLCLFKVLHDKEGTVKHVPVAIDTIKKWKTTIVQKLAEKARLISGFSAEETVEEINQQIEELEEKRDKLLQANVESVVKNSPTDTPDTSNSVVS